MGVEHDAVIKYLVDKFGKSKQKTYSFDNFVKTRKGRFRAYYVNNIPECNAWVDVVFSEGWMETLGKFIVYGNQLIHEKYQPEFWLVWSISEYWVKYHKKRNLIDKPKYLIDQRSQILWLYYIAKKAIIKDLHNRIKLFDFDPENKESLVISDNWEINKL